MLWVRKSQRSGVADLGSRRESGKDCGWLWEFVVNFTKILQRKRPGTVYLALRIFINMKLRLFSLSLFSLFYLLQLSLFRLHAFSNYHHIVVYCFILTFARPVFDYTS